MDAFIPTYEIWSNNFIVNVNVPSEFYLGLTSVSFTSAPCTNSTFVKKLDGHTSCEYKSLIVEADIRKYFSFGQAESGQVGGFIVNDALDESMIE